MDPQGMDDVLCVEIPVSDGIEEDFNPEEAEAFARWLEILNAIEIPFVISGALAIYAYTGIWRNTKDLDVFLKPSGLKPALDAISAAGYKTEIRDRRWLAKVFHRSYFMDLIFGLSNNMITMTDEWFENSRTMNLLGVQVPLIGLENLIASKCYIARGDRFDGADIVHLILASKGRLEWNYISHLLKDDPYILLWHLTLFGYVYPGHADYLPMDMMKNLFNQMTQEMETEENPKRFRGTLLDPLKFRVDCERWGYENRTPRTPLVNHKGEEI
ncbi:MAG: nucleotidyltransferase [Thermodesulfobacteriota bacterium]